ncbi:DUF1269 domain-containing protein [Isoptericola cucumis]|uniref:Membrane protein n=1 Tax=Isoptericola cucumis TaxID=1776856 RepID=A0ABQ2B3H3_9MICO|nr:DUF1269 domain-containing protein [Isoptericola cucumis]GGI05075.1 membrane protein [Isoptericola cucumis]
MARFMVWKFDDPEAAGRAVHVLKDAEAEGLVKIIDHSVVSWPEGAKKPTAHGQNEDAAKASGWGAFWGLLLGALFFLPVIGAVAGAAIGGITKALSEVGISGKDIDAMKEQIVPGTSALFLVTEQIDPDRLAERFHGVQATLVSTNLTDAERRTLLDTFGQ